MSGKLYLVATPIGNLDDITKRALDTLAFVDIIAAEDTRKSLKLLNHFNIKKPLISYYEHNKLSRGDQLLAELAAGKNIALISDAGTPAISDPGAELVQAAIAAEVEVIAIPGANALLSALIVSGIDTGRFAFEGFPARQKAARRRQFEDLIAEERTLIFYEAPHRLRATLADMAEAFGSERPMAIGREMTKMYEETIRGSIGDIVAHFEAVEPRGEFTLVVAGAPCRGGNLPPADYQLEAELEQLLNNGLSRKEAARQIAQKYNTQVKRVYELGIK